MRAVLFEQFGETPRIATVPDPAPPPHGAVIEVRATGVCHSDWHAWMGHDPDVRLPHVPGHEFAGLVREVGRDVRRFAAGERVTAPFVSACGACPECRRGDQQVCRDQTQPGFTHWGSFAQYVVIDHADVNLVRLPASLRFDAAASLGCRFVTAFRAVVDQGRVSPSQWLAVHGCGGVGLSAVMIGCAAGARVIAIDVDERQLDLARSLGAAVTVDAGTVGDVAGAVVEASGGGVDVSIDALGHPDTCANSIASLQRMGTHIQVGLLLAEQARPPLPMDRVIAYELRVVGSHGMQAHRYRPMLQLIESGRLRPERLLGRTITLEQSVEALATMESGSGPGVTVVTEF